MKQASKRPTFFDQLKDGLDECLAFTRGELALRTAVVASSAPPISPQEIARLRKALDLSQAVFARVLNVSVKTVRNWEQGERKPTQAALRLLQVMKAEPDVVCQIAGLVNGSRSRLKETAVP
jgi:putative transcriptional regulator